MADKNMNYSDADTVRMVAAYESADSAKERDAVVVRFAGELSKTKRSVIAKLVREGVYVKKATTKHGGKAETKDSIVNDIAKACDVSSGQLAGLEKATKGALQIVRRTLENFSEAEDLDDEAETEAATA